MTCSCKWAWIFSQIDNGNQTGLISLISIAGNLTSIWSVVTRGVLAFLVLLPLSAFAHEVRPSIVDITPTPTGEFELSVKFNMEAYLARIGSEHDDTQDSPNGDEYERLRQLSPEELASKFKIRLLEFTKMMQLSFDGEPFALTFVRVNVPPIGDVDLARDSFAHFNGIIPAGVNQVNWQYQLGASVLRFVGENINTVTQYVAAGDVSEAIAIDAPRQRGAFNSFFDYVEVGFDHIIPKGLDHILFVVGLFLLSARLRPLLWQITSFTVAHTVTLGLGIAGVLSIPANIVEPLIALSIIYVGVENIFMNRLSPWRPAVVFFFGLLHGLGFAGVLKEFGLDQGNFIAGLIGFNVGVELGQLAVIAVCFLAVGLWFGRKDWYHARITIPGSVAISLIASWWFYERVFLA